MTSVKNPLAYKNKRAFRKYVVQIWPQKPRPGNMCCQNIAVREGPRRFREGKREGETGACNGFHKSLKVREGSAKGNAKLETCMSKTRSPRRFAKVPRRETRR